MQDWIPKNSHACEFVYDGTFDFKIHNCLPVSDTLLKFYQEIETTKDFLLF